MYMRQEQECIIRSQISDIFNKDSLSDPICRIEIRSQISLYQPSTSDNRQDKLALEKKKMNLDTFCTHKYYPFRKQHLKLPF